MGVDIRKKCVIINLSAGVLLLARFIVNRTIKRRGAAEILKTWGVFTMKKLLAMALALVMCLGVTTMAWAEEKYDGFTKGETGTNGMDTYSIDVTDQAGLQKAITATDSFGANMVINIKNDITITGEWTPGYLNGYGTNGAGTGVVTVNGNGYKIVGLSSMLFSSVWAGKCGLIVNDLTLENANVEVAKLQTTSFITAGAEIFIKS